MYTLAILTVLVGTSWYPTLIRVLRRLVTYSCREPCWWRRRWWLVLLATCGIMVSVSVRTRTHCAVIRYFVCCWRPHGFVSSLTMVLVPSYRTVGAVLMSRTLMPAVPVIHRPYSLILRLYSLVHSLISLIHLLSLPTMILALVVEQYTVLPSTYPCIYYLFS